MKRTTFRRHRTPGAFPPDWRDLEYAALHVNEAADIHRRRLIPRVVLDIDGERTETGLLAPGADHRAD
jgi:hypothetical protein